MKHIAGFILLLVVGICCSCNNTYKNSNQSGKGDNGYSVQGQYRNEESSTISNQGEKNTRTSISGAVIDRYDDGLLDGEAAAEEDRLAGKPGMQVGDEDDEDDEDYDDGYDDGYDE